MNNIVIRLLIGLILLIKAQRVLRSNTFGVRIFSFITKTLVILILIINSLSGIVICLCVFFLRRRVVCLIVCIIRLLGSMPWSSGLFLFMVLSLSEIIEGVYGLLLLIYFLLIGLVISHFRVWPLLEQMLRLLLMLLLLVLNYIGGLLVVESLI